MNALKAIPIVGIGASLLSSIFSSGKSSSGSNIDKNTIDKTGVSASDFEMLQRARLRQSAALKAPSVKAGRSLLGDYTDSTTPGL